MSEVEFHPVANIFPLLTGDEFDALVADIAENGQLEPIWLHQDQIIDGRNRYRACCELELVPEYREWSGDGSLVAFVMSMNLHRRHLTSSQRAVIALDILPILEDEARERMLAGVRADPVEIFPQGEQGKARDVAGEMVGVSGRYVSDAKRLQQEAPEMLEQVRAGELSIPEAKKEHRKQERQTKREMIANITPADIPNNVTLYAGDMLEIMPTLGKFDLVLTDPPYGVTDWEWDKLNTKAWLDVIIPHLADEYNLFWFCSPQFAADTEIIFRDHDLAIQSRIVWHRRNMALGSAAKNKFIDTWEMILHAGNRPLNFPVDWSDAWFDVQVFPVPQTNFADAKIHPTQKPHGLISRLVEFGSYPEDTILDPFAGSGTTAAACPKDRHCTLIELQDEYATVIENRLGVSRE